MPMNGDLEVVEYFYNPKTKGGLPQWVLDLDGSGLQELIQSIPNKDKENEELINALNELR